jgi:hypothetical protein
MFDDVRSKQRSNPLSTEQDRKDLESDSRGMGQGNDGRSSRVDDQRVR